MMCSEPGKPSNAPKKPMRFSIQWIVQFVAIVFICVACVYILSYRLYYQSQSVNVEMFLDEIIDQTTVSIKGDLEQAYTLANNTYLNLEVQQSLLLDNAIQSTTYDRYKATQNIRGLSLGNPIINNMAIYPINGKSYKTGGSPLRYETCRELRQQEWFRSISKSESGFYLLSPAHTFLTEEQANTIVLARTMYASNSKNIIGYQFLMLNIGILTSNTDQQTADNALVQFFLCDRNGNLLFLDQEDEIHVKNRMENARYITKRSQISEEIYLIGICDQTLINQQVWRPLFGIIISVLLTMLACIVFVYFLSRQISGPTRVLSDCTTEIGKGNFNVQIPRFAVSELDMLGQGFANMLKQIEELIDNLVEEKNINQALEIRVLLSQMNPHFLYNTLNSIYWMNYSGNNAEAGKMIQTLSNLLRYGLYKVDSMVALDQEIQHGIDYLYLQSKRYEGRMLWDIEIEAHMRINQVPKLVLQPLLENAIIHSVEPAAQTVHIQITGWEDTDSMSLEVSNDISGDVQQVKMMMEKALRATSGDNQRKGIGLFNVHRRIQIAYGEGYGLTIYERGQQICVRACLRKTGLERGAEG